MPDEQVRKWQGKIREAQEFRRKYGRDRDWKRYRDYYRANWTRFDMASYLPLNVVYSMAKALLPEVYPRTPAVRVTATKPWFEPHATILEAVDNYLLRKLDVSFTIRKAALMAYLYGTGPIKFGFDREFGTPSALQQLTRGTVVGSFENRLDKGGHLLEYNKLVQPGMPWMLPDHPGNFVVPWGVTELRNAPWCAFRIVRSLADVKKDPMYRKVKDLHPTWFNGAPARWEPTDKGDDVPRYDSPSELLKRSDDEQFVELWEIHDLERGEIKVLTRDHGTWLRKDEDTLLLDGLPADAIIFNDDDQAFWGIADVRYIEPQQLEMNDILTQWQKIRRTAVPKFVATRDSIDEDELAKLMSEEVRAVVFCDGDPKAAIAELKPTTGGDLLLAARYVWENIREILGFSRNQLGEFDVSTRRTATEANMVKEGHTVRMGDRRDVVAKVLLRAVHKFNQMVFAFWTQPQVLQVVGKDGMRYWVEFTGAQLAGEFDYKVDLDAEVPQTKDVRKQEAIMAFQAFNQDPLIDQLELRRWVLSQAESAPVERLLAPGLVQRGQPNAAMPFNQFVQQRQQPSALAAQLGGGR